MDIEELQLITKALAFSSQKHRDQRRKDPDASPYINHPISLVDILVNEGEVTNFKAIVGAILHDTIEDTETTGEEIESEFGRVIRQIVEDVTDDKSLDKMARKRMQIEHAPHICHEAKLVKLADKISNLRDVANCPPAQWSLQRRKEYFDWAKQVIDGLRGVHPKLEAVFDQTYTLKP